MGVRLYWDKPELGGNSLMEKFVLVGASADYGELNIDISTVLKK